MNIITTFSSSESKYSLGLASYSIDPTIPKLLAFYLQLYLDTVVIGFVIIIGFSIYTTPTTPLHNTERLYLHSNILITISISYSPIWFIFFLFK